MVRRSRPARASLVSMPSSLRTGCASSSAAPRYAALATTCAPSASHCSVKASATRVPHWVAGTSSPAGCGRSHARTRRPRGLRLPARGRTEERGPVGRSDRVGVEGIQQEDGYAAIREPSDASDRLLAERSDHEVGTLLDRGPKELSGDPRSGVMHRDHGTFAVLGGVPGGEESVTHRGGGRCEGSGKRQQERDVAWRRTTAPDLVEQLGEDRGFRRVVGESLAPVTDRGLEGGKVETVRSREPPELEPPRRLARISHRLSSRGRRDGAVAGRTD